MDTLWSTKPREDFELAIRTDHYFREFEAPEIPLNTLVKRFYLNCYGCTKLKNFDIVEKFIKCMPNLEELKLDLTYVKLNEEDFEQLLKVICENKNIQ